MNNFLPGKSYDLQSACRSPTSFFVALAIHGKGDWQICEAGQFLGSPPGGNRAGRAGVAGIYDRATYAREMREALERWARRLEAITK